MRSNIIRKTSETSSQYIWGRKVPLQITWFNPPPTPSQNMVSRRNLLGDQLGFEHFNSGVSTGSQIIHCLTVFLRFFSFYSDSFLYLCMCISFICKTAEDTLCSTVVILSWSWPIKLRDLFSATLHEPDPQDTEPHVNHGLFPYPSEIISYMKYTKCSPFNIFHHD